MDIEKVMQDPSDYFEHPGEVATAPGLSIEQKVKILESWELDVDRRLSSTAENMPGDETAEMTTELQKIRSTLSDLRQ